MRLVDADALPVKFDGHTVGVWKSDLDAAPTIEAEPVKHGRWIDRPGTKGQVYCSECRTLETSTDSNYKSRRCPNCGVKMLPTPPKGE